MKRLYIFDTYLYSLRCGLGAYLKNLAAVVSQWEGWNVCFIMFKTNVKKCTIYTCKGIDYILLPQEQVGNLFPNPPLRQDLLPLIETDEECIFMYNYLPYNQLVQTMKEGIPTAKHISAIHDFRQATLVDSAPEAIINEFSLFSCVAFSKWARRGELFKDKSIAIPFCPLV